MSRDQLVREKLLKFGKEEFLSKGYEKASLRCICKKAGVTTGALYFFFENKEDLFTKAVSSAADSLRRLIIRQTEEEISGKKTSAENEREFVEFLYFHREEMEILFDRSEGTVFADFKSEICDMLKKGFYIFYDKFGGDEKYRNIVDIVMKMRMQGYIELLRGDYDLETALKYTEMMAVYGDGGFAEMMKQLNRITKGSV